MWITVSTYNPPKVMKIIQEVEFSMDDISDDIDFYVSDEISDNIVFDSETVQEILEVIRESSWFVQGNKTEGILSIGERLEGNGRFVLLYWNKIMMEITPNGDVFDDSEDNEVELILTLKDNKWVLKPY